MKRLLLIAALFCSVAAFGQALRPIYTIGTNGGSNPCFAGTTCTMHPTTTAGDTLAIGLTVAGSGGITAVSGGCSGSWAHPANVRQVDTTSGWSLDVWKCDSASGGTPTVTATTATTPKGGILVDIPYGSGASGVFDTSGGQVSASTLTPTGVPLTLATADEIILQFSFYDNAVATCQVPTIDTYYFYGVCQTEVGTGPSRSVAIQENGAYGSTPQLTYTGTAATSVQSAIAFKILGSTPAPVYSLVGTTAFTNQQWGSFADSSGNLYTVSDNATTRGVQFSSNHGVTWSALNTGLTCPTLFNGGISYNGTPFVTNWQCGTNNYAYYLSGSTWVKDSNSTVIPSGGNYVQCANVTIGGVQTTMCGMDSANVLASTDGGHSWALQGNASFSAKACTQTFGIAQKASGVLYIGGASPSGVGCGTWTSTDGLTWTQNTWPSQVTARTIDIGGGFIMPNGTYAGYYCTWFNGTVNGIYCYGPGDPPSGSWVALNNPDMGFTPAGNTNWYVINRTDNRVLQNSYPSSGNNVWPTYTDDGANFVFGGFGLPYDGTVTSRAPRTSNIVIDPTTGISYLFFNTGPVYASSVTQDINPVVSSSLSPSTATINLNQSQQETVTYTYADATTGSVCPAPNTNSWNSASPLVATVNSSGLVSPVSSGTAVITNVCNGITSSSATITVNGTPTLTSITQSCTPTSLIQNGTGTCTVTCHYSDSSTSNCGGALGYTTDNSACVTIAANGVTGLYTAAPTLNQTCTANVGLTIGAVSSTPTAISVNSYPPAALFGTVQVLGTATIIP